MALAPRWRTRGTQAQVGGDLESGPLSLRVSGPPRPGTVTGADQRPSDTAASGQISLPGGECHSLQASVDFELALKLEVDPAARRPGPGVRVRVTVTPVLRPWLPACASGPAVWSRSRRHGATNSTGQCLGQRTAPAAAADGVAGADGCSLSSGRRRPGIMMGHRDSYNFELALKLEVDPAARRRARRHRRDAGPTVLRLTPAERSRARARGH